MAKIPEQLKQILQELQLAPQDAVWDCHGTPVVLHKALAGGKVGVEHR